MPGLDLLLTNLLSPIVLAFVLGAVAGAIRSELELPEPVLKLLSIYLLFSIGLVGGRELALAKLSDILGLIGLAAAATIAIPVVCFIVLRRLGRFDVANAAAVAAHYGSVSSVTFFAAMAFARAADTPAEGYMTAVVAVMEWGVIVALMLARWSMGRQRGTGSLKELIVDTLRGRGILLLTGGMIIGLLAGDRGWAQIAPFYEHLFRGILMLFLLEMGMTASRKLKDLRTAGPGFIAFALLAPNIFAPLGIILAHLYSTLTHADFKPGTYVLFAVLWLAARRDAIRGRAGVLSGMFLTGYALARITGEFFREPDAFLGYLYQGTTMGQLLSLPMLAAGVFLMVWPRRV